MSMGVEWMNNENEVPVASNVVGVGIIRGSEQTVAERDAWPWAFGWDILGNDEVQSVTMEKGVAEVRLRAGSLLVKSQRLAIGALEIHSTPYRASNPQEL